MDYQLRCAGSVANLYPGWHYYSQGGRTIRLFSGNTSYWFQSCICLLRRMEQIKDFKSVCCAVSLFTFLESFDGLRVVPSEVQAWSHHPFTIGCTPSKHRGIL